MTLHRPPHVVVQGLTAFSILAAVTLVFWSATGTNATFWRLLGIASVPPASIPHTATIVIGPQASIYGPPDGAIASPAPVFGPPAVAIASGGQITFVNRLATPIVIRSTTAAPVPFRAVVAAHARTSVTLVRPGIYHYYDASAAHPLPPPDPNSEYPGPTPFTDPSDVIVPKSGTGPPRDGWIAVLGAVPGLRQRLTIPLNHAVFTPKVLVAVAGSTIVVSNRDTYAHNFVVDPSSPTGAAFIIDGVHDIPAYGARRALVLQQPGLYHVYCTMHTHVIGLIDGWHRVKPSLQGGAWSGDAHNPMEAWIIVLPATVMT